MKRKKYTREFKLQAVKLVIEEDFSFKTVSKKFKDSPKFIV
ncbi:MAG TPA: transposase [Acholeplasmataceae bacterium]|nr:transposase [Acholeplasmataceae bacterium]